MALSVNYGNLLAPPKSALDYQREYQAIDDEKAARQLNALAMQEKRAQLADADLERQQRAGYANLLAQNAGRTPDELIPALERAGTPYAMTQAQALRKAQLEAQAKQVGIEKDRATAAHSTAQTEQIRSEQKQKLLTRAMDDVMSAQNPQQAMQLVQQYSSVLDPVALQGMTRELMGVQTPEQMDAWKYRRVAAIHGLKTAEEMRLARLDKQSTLANRDMIEDPNRPGQFIVNAPLDAAKVRRAQASAPITMGAPVAGIDTRTGQPAFFQPGNRPGVAPQIVPDIAPAPKKGEGISATLQKELIEADDLAQNSANVGDALRRALSINDKAYSGYQATNRAKVRSNLPGQDPSADATIELENLIAGQGLESLRAIFGGNPTEGERKILLDLQASTDKTPAQRKAIIERAIQAADKRQQFAKNRAEAIRSGTYLSQGAAPVSAPAAPAAGQSRVVNFGDLK